jgi:signal transduction histidine kinase
MFNAIYNKFIPFLIKEDVHNFAHAKNIINCGLIALVAVPSYALVYYLLNFPAASFIVIITGICILSATFLLKPLHSLTLSRELIVGPLFFCLTWLSYFLGGIFSPTIFWLILPPMLSIILGGIFSAFIWGMLCVLTVILLYFIESLHISFPPQVISNLLFLQMFSLSGLILIILFLSYFFEKGRLEGSYEIQKINQKLVIANQVKSDFLANISHELLTPLNGIIGFTQLLQSGKIDVQHSKEFFEDILVSSHHLTQIINNILEIANIESDKIEFHPSNINLRHLLNEMKEFFQEEIQRKNLQIQINLNPFLSTVYFDPGKLKQVIYHLLANAIKFNEPYGKIEINVRAINDKFFCIEVKDSGIGIKPNDLQKIFNKFQQLDESMGKKYGGLGLGLFIINRIVEAQNGKIEVHSEFGKGSKFSVILPIHS